MIKIKEVKFEGKKFLQIWDRLYTREENPIGVRSKFWVVRQSGKLIFEPPILTNMLFKYKRNDLSSEDYGEVISSRFYSLCGLDTVEYHSAEFETLKGECVRGVLCGSYKRNNTEVETSGYDLQCHLSQFSYDEVTGVTNKQINTVCGFIDDLHSIFKDFPDHDYFLNIIKNDLIKQSLLDFLIAQSDRHWTNTTFLEYFNKDGEYRIRKAKCYDNGCIAFLKRKRQAIDTFASMIDGDYLDSPIMKNLMSKYCPMFGIKTSTCLIDTRIAAKYKKHDKIKVNPDPKFKSIYLQELVSEILQNPQITYFYINLKEKIGYNRKTKSINLRHMFNSLKESGEDIPESIQELVTGIVTYQINEIEQELLKQLGRFGQLKSGGAKNESDSTFDL